MVTESAPLLQLMQTKGLGPRSLARVIDLLGQDKLSLRDFVALATEEMVDRYGLKVEQASAIHANEPIARQLAEVLEHHRVRPVLRGGSSYPSRLQSILGDRAPPVLFTAGSLELIHRRGVGFCGARDASEEALDSGENQRLK
jgi:predicted Rossmann fold nucleotide-binding protein DprA/Smf involved in DNA uptake